MAGTILPIGYGDQKKMLFGVMAIHSLGYIIGSGVLGALAGAAGHVSKARSLWIAIPHSGALAALGVAAIVFAARELRLCRVPYPQSRWQVPVRWRGQMSIHSMAFAYAFVLGFGLATRFPAAGLIVSMWALINGKVLVGTGVLCGFGIGRTIPLVVAWRVRKVLSVYALVNTVSRSNLAMEMASGLLLSIVGGMLLGGGWVFAK